jgi:hypothetical protein
VDVYDWFYDKLSSSLKARVRRVVKRWIRAYEREGFGRNFPQGNYYAGYYDATALAAMAIAPDGGNVQITYKRWLTRLQRPVQRYYAGNLSGGGWPEGWNYGPVATWNQSMPVLAARTAKHIDLTSAPFGPYRWPLNTGKHLVWFTWPDRATLEDDGAVYAADNPTEAPAWLYIFQAAVLDEAHEPFAPYLRSFAHTVQQIANDASLGAAWTAWIDFLFDRGQPQADFEQLPLSYFAQGLDMAAMRSSWATDAVWASFQGGPYVNNPGNGEEYCDKGSLAIVRGNRPFLVNTAAALQRNTPGTDDGDEFSQQLLSDLFDDTVTRSVFNVFYVNRPTPTGQEGFGRRQGARTRMSAFEDADGTAFMRSVHLEDQYPRTGEHTIKSWTREVAYLRPQTFVVHDLTTVTDPSLSQWVAFHFGASPQLVSRAGGVTSYDVTIRSGYAGRVHVVLPAAHYENTVNVYGSGKVFGLEIHGAHAASQEWLMVFDTAPSAAAASTALPLTAAAGSVLAGPVSGVVVQRPDGNQAVLFSQRDAANPDHRVAALPGSRGRHSTPDRGAHT